MKETWYCDRCGCIFNRESILPIVICPKCERVGYNELGRVKWGEGLTKAITEPLESMKKVDAKNKHQRRVANRQKLYEKKHSEPFERRMAKICKSCNFRHNSNVDGKSPEDWRDCGDCEQRKGGEVLEKEWRRKNK